MLSALFRYAVIIVGLVAAGVIGGQAAAATWSVRGMSAPLVLASERPFVALVSVFAAMVAIGVVGGIAGRLSNAAVGMFVAGAGVAALAMRTGTIMDVVFGATALNRIGAETILWGAVTIVMAMVVFRIAGPLQDMRPEDPRGTIGPWHGAFTRPAWAGLVTGAIAILACWFMLRTDMKGQAIAGAVLGGMLCGLLGRLWHPHVQPVLLFGAPSLALGIAQFVATGAVKGPADSSFVTGQLPRLLGAMPLDIAGGGAMGVAMGLGWAKSFLHVAEPATSEGTVPTSG
ncbi:MAG: hypothetical protein KDA22_12315 [Phycisphaerales bacterium]|nr:hypothetical protein [Phycisphaerales bacterium]